MTNLATLLSKPAPEAIIACISPFRSFDVLAWAYSDAAKMLAKHIDEDGFYIDIAVHPLCFLYRHSLELRLKQLVWDGRQLLGEDGRLKEICSSHKLLPLWREANKIMQVVWAEVEIPDEIQMLNELVEWFESCDPTSVGFRYPFTANLEPTLPGQTRINITRLFEIMEATGSFLTGATTAISHYLSEQPNDW